jgi:hypothetical protein
VQHHRNFEAQGVEEGVEQWVILFSGQPDENLLNSAGGQDTAGGYSGWLVRLLETKKIVLWSYISS